jgi:hypothetical protein
MKEVSLEGGVHYSWMTSSNQPTHYLQQQQQDLDLKLLTKSWNVKNIPNQLCRCQ